MLAGRRSMLYASVADMAAAAAAQRKQEAAEQAAKDQQLSLRAAEAEAAAQALLKVSSFVISRVSRANWCHMTLLHCAGWQQRSADSSTAVHAQMKLKGIFMSCSSLACDVHSIANTRRKSRALQQRHQPAARAAQHSRRNPKRRPSARGSGRRKPQLPPPPPPPAERRQTRAPAAASGVRP